MRSYSNQSLLVQEETDMNTGSDESIEHVESISNADEDNFGTARRLASAKYRLINALAISPISTVWLLHKYPDMEVEKDEAIKTAFLAHPFSFDDILELTNFSVYWFKHKKLMYQKSEYLVKKRAYWLRKRLINIKNKPIYSELVANKELELSDDLVYQQVLAIVNAEQSWLAFRQRLVEKNSKLVSYIANQHKSNFLDFEDLVQEGQTGLLVAVDKFDYRLGCQFSTYAVYWIRQRILRALSQNERVVRLPYEQIGSINRLFRAKDELLAKNGVEPSVEDLASYLDMSTEDISTLLAISQTAVPLENTDSDDDESIMPIDIVEQHVFQTPFKQLARTEFERWLERATKVLNARELKVVCNHFGLYTDREMTLQEIGAELNISRERVRQIQVTAFNKMKLNYGEQLVSFL